MEKFGTFYYFSNDRIQLRQKSPNCTHYHIRHISGKIKKKRISKKNFYCKLPHLWFSLLPFRPFPSFEPMHTVASLWRQAHIQLIKRCGAHIGRKNNQRHLIAGCGGGGGWDGEGGALRGWLTPSSGTPAFPWRIVTGGGCRWLTSIRLATHKVRENYQRHGGGGCGWDGEGWALRGWLTPSSGTPAFPWRNVAGGGCWWLTSASGSPAHLLAITSGPDLWPLDGVCPTSFNPLDMLEE